MRINQTMAKEVAIKMTEKMALETKTAFKEYQDFVHDEYLKQVPLVIIETFRKHPDFFQTTSTVALVGAGFLRDNAYVNIQKTVIKNGNGYYANLEADNKLAVKIKGLQNKYYSIQQKHKNLKDKIETALNGLRTFAQVEKHLPEALQFLPKSSSMELVVNFDKLREEIKAA